MKLLVAKFMLSLFAHILHIYIYIYIHTYIYIGFLSNNMFFKCKDY